MDSSTPLSTSHPTTDALATASTSHIILDATNTPFSFSLLTSKQHNASKKLIADHNGRPVSDPAHRLGITAGTIEHVQLAGLAGLRDFLQGVTTKQALVHGVHRDSSPGELCTLATLAELATLTQNGASIPPNTIARSLDYIGYPDGVRLIMLDVDPYPEVVTPETASELIQQLALTWPGFAEVGWLATVSTRSAIKDKQTHAWLTPPAGFHVYILATGDVARFQDLARVRLWLAGTGYCKLASVNAYTGVSAVLERCMIDLAVFSPERLDYIAGAIIPKNAPFYQDRPPPVLHPGAVLDLDALPQVTDDDRQQYVVLVQAEHARVTPAREAAVRAHIQQASPALDAEAIAQEITARLARTAGGFLLPDHPLVFEGGRALVTAGTVTASRDNKRLADPFEPDYGPSHAVFHWNNGHWLINSFSHGILKTYRLAQTEPTPPKPDEDDFQHLLTDGDPQENTRPVIRITTEMQKIVDQGQTALLALPEAPVIFQRARTLCVIARGVTPPRWLHRPHDAPVILEASPARLRELVSQAARWEKYDARQEEWVSALPSSWFVETLQGRPAWPFPVLEGIIGAPTLRPDGSVLDTQGYDVSTGLWFDSNGTHYLALTNQPTIDDARNAVNTVRDVLRDFPFVGSSFAAALSAVLSVVCRFTIGGCVPLFAARSTTRGSGKGLLIDVLSIIGTGRPAPRWPQSDNDEEDRKRLLTVAMAGDATMHIDNVVKQLGSPALDLALTAPSVADRILGKSAKVEAPLTLVWFASGNNMQFKGDTARRVVPMDLDARMERPEERTGFAYPRLLDYVRQTRPALVSAALTIVHAYFQAGKPAQGLSPYGSFQEWSDLIRSAVVWAVGADPCEGRKNLEAESDPAFDRLATLLDCWEACYSDKDATVVQALQDVSLQVKPVDMNNPVNKWHELHSALSAFDPTYRGQQLNPRAIGVEISKTAGRIIDGKRFVRGMKRTKAGYPWRVAGVSGVSSVSIYNHGAKSVREGNEEKSQSQKEKTELESLTFSEKLLEQPTLLTLLTPLTPLTDSPDPNIPEAVQHACPRCGELTAHAPGADGGLACTWCSTLPDDQVFSAKDGGTPLGSVPAADAAVEYEELT